MNKIMQNGCHIKVIFASISISKNGLITKNSKGNKIILILLINYNKSISKKMKILL